MRFQVDANKKAKQWVSDFNSVCTISHLEKLEHTFCKSLLLECYQGGSLVKQANDKYNSVRVQLTRTDGLFLKQDGFLEFLKKETPFGNVAVGIENMRKNKNFVIEHVHKHAV